MRKERSDMKALEEMGWEFLQYGPDDWQWMKFDAVGTRIASQNDAMWNSDLRIIAGRG